MRTLVLVLGMMALAAVPCLARQDQAAGDEPAVVRYDSSAVVARTPAPESLQRYRNDADFVYDRAANPSGSWWSRFKSWLFERLFGELYEASYSPIVNWVIYILGAVGIVYAIARLLRMDLGRAFSAKDERTRLAFETVAGDPTRL